MCKLVSFRALCTNLSLGHVELSQRLVLDDVHDVLAGEARARVVDVTDRRTLPGACSSR